MPNVVIPFRRKSRAAAARAESEPRHRRDGHFDDNDEWHSAAGQTSPAAEPASH